MGLDLTPRQARQAIMEANNLTQADIGPLIGSESAVSMFLGGQRVVNVDDLMNLMRDLVKELLPEPNITGTVHDKAVRFQCQNKADIEGAAVLDEAIRDEDEGETEQNSS